MIKEGFWYSEYEPDLPKPIKYKGDWDKDSFLRALIKLEYILLSDYFSVLDQYNNGNKEAYDKYNEKKGYVQSYRGFSHCRLAK